MIALLCFFLTLFASEFSVHTAAAPTLNFIRRRILAIFDANAPEITNLSFTGWEVLRRHSLDHMTGFGDAHLRRILDA